MAAGYQRFAVGLAMWIGERVRSERGASLVEYALLVALIAVTCIASIDYMGGVAADKFGEVGSAVGRP
jgi:pilus assembly protein Flp/PilA